MKTVMYSTMFPQIRVEIMEFSKQLSNIIKINKSFKLFSKLSSTYNLHCRAKIRYNTLPRTEKIWHVIVEVQYNQHNMLCTVCSSTISNEVTCKLKR